MLDQKLARFLVLPELKLQRVEKGRRAHIYHCNKEESPEYCPGCGLESTTTYDHRWVTLRDEAIRQSQCLLRVRKRRLYCKSCRKLPDCIELTHPFAWERTHRSVSDAAF